MTTKSHPSKELAYGVGKVQKCGGTLLSLTGRGVIISRRNSIVRGGVHDDTPLRELELKTTSKVTEEKKTRGRKVKKYLHKNGPVYRG
jgi:hypothetical protein